MVRQLHGQWSEGVLQFSVRLHHSYYWSSVFDSGDDSQMCGQKNLHTVWIGNQTPRAIWMPVQWHTQRSPFPIRMTALMFWRQDYACIREPTKVNNLLYPTFKTEVCTYVHVHVYTHTHSAFLILVSSAPQQSLDILVDAYLLRDTATMFRVVITERSCILQEFIYLVNIRQNVKKYPALL